MSLIKEALDKAEEEENSRREADRETGAGGLNLAETICWIDVVLGAVIVIISALVSAQVFLLIWLLLG